MFARGPSSGVWKKATEVTQVSSTVTGGDRQSSNWPTQASIRREQRQNKSPNATAASHRRCLSSKNGARTPKTNGTAVRSSTAAETKQKREVDRVNSSLTDLRPSIMC
jgi:hypothetical protein